jgi:hypothetical protein
MFDYFVGLDLGQAFDFTALAVLEEAAWVPPEAPDDPAAALLWPPDQRGWTSPSELLPAQAEHFRRLTYRSDGYRPGRPSLLCRHLERVRQISYATIVGKVATLLRRPPLAGARTALVVDYTGVGRAVVDQLVQAGLRPICVSIHGGTDVSADAGAFHVPKRDLVVATQAALQDGRLRIAAGLEHAETLTRELLSYRVKISAAGRDSYSAREGEHDDLLLAVSLATWFRDHYNQSYDYALDPSRRSAFVTSEAYR